MLVLQGYFEYGRFISKEPVVIPNHTEATVTIPALPKKSAPVNSTISNRDAWLKFLEALQSCDEPVPDHFERVSFLNTVK